MPAAADSKSKQGLTGIPYSSITAGVLIGISALTILFNINEMVLYCMKRLSPLIMVVFNTINTLIWTVILILLAISAVRVRSSGISLVLIIIVL
jgi:hypothetical protein